MGFKEIHMMEIYEIIRRWHANQKIRHIAKSCGYDRKTVRKYIAKAQKAGILQDQNLPPKEEVIRLFEPILAKEIKQSTPAKSILEPYLFEIIELVNSPTNALKPKIAFEVVVERHQLVDKVSYSTFKRFAQENQILINPQKSTCRIEVAPGIEVQIDYGLMGLLYDPLLQRNRRVYAFIATLSCSRHIYVEFVFKQNQQSFVISHVRMFEYFGGVPMRVLIDNLKTGVIKPDLYDPTLNRAYRELAEHYHCFIDPCRVRHAKDKGKVENQVPVVRQQFRKLLALDSHIDIGRANQQIQSWCLGPYGSRIHGTTHWQPYPTFLAIEKPTLKPLPDEPFEAPIWKNPTVHPDHYIQFNTKAYSIPHAYVGKKVWVRGTDKLIKVYFDNRLIKQHVITPHYRHTDFKDFPENVRAALDEGVPKFLQDKAAQISNHFMRLVRNVLEPHAFLNMRKAQGIVGLSQKYDARLVDQAARITLDNGLEVTPKAFKKLLENLLHQQQCETPINISEQTQDFIRPMNYFDQRRNS